MDTKDINPKRRPELAQTEIIDQLPKACQDETAAVEFIEQRRWGNSPCCAKCGSVNVYKMTDAKTGARSKRFLWRCRDCSKMFTARTGTVFEESLIPLRHWCYAFWRVACSKKGVAALEIARQCQISYKSALFMMHRVRFALAPKGGPAKKLKGIVEVDEVYLGGRPRNKGNNRRGLGTKKTPVLGIVERDGNIHRQVVTDVSSKTVTEILKKRVSVAARMMTDESPVYRRLPEHFDSHESVKHSVKEYVRGDVHTNTVESSHALVKRGLMGIYHAVSKHHLHRYLAQWDFVWNTRKMNDGQRAVLAIQSAQGKRLMYRDPVNNSKNVSPNVG